MKQLFGSLFSWLHDTLVPAALGVTALAADPATAGLVHQVLGARGPAILAIAAALAHFGDNKLNSYVAK